MARSRSVEEMALQPDSSSDRRPNPRESSWPLEISVSDTVVLSWMVWLAVAAVYRRFSGSAGQEDGLDGTSHVL